MARKDNLLIWSTPSKGEGEVFDVSYWANLTPSETLRHQLAYHRAQVTKHEAKYAEVMYALSKSRSAFGSAGRRHIELKTREREIRMQLNRHEHNVVKFAKKLMLGSSADG